VAVILVFLTHFASVFKVYVQADPLTSTLIDSVHETITKAGVFLFFVLSGYLIYSGLLKKREPYLQFLWRRVKRLYPTFLCVLLLYIVLSFVFPSRSKIPHAVKPATIYILENLAFLPGVFNIEPIIEVTWSLSYQLVFYLSIPLVVGALGLRNRPGWQRALFCAGLALLACACSLIVQLDAPLPGQAAHRFLALICALMFIAGMLLYESAGFLRRRTGLATISQVPALLAFLFILWFRNQHEVFSAWPPLEFYRPLLLALLIFVCFFAFSFYTLAFNGFLAQWLSWAPLQKLGKISYSFFLFHGLTLNAAALLLSWLVPPSGQDVLLFWLMLPVGFVLSLVASALLFALVERPFSTSAARLSQSSNLAAQALPSRPTA
jgi:peptidoglycan/LPS O-acetylase OafA/YrhL